MADSHRSKSDTRKSSHSYPGFVQLFFKQTISSIVIGILFFLMSVIPVPGLNNCARALGDALRYEMKIPAEKLPQWIKERLFFPQ